MGHFTSSQKTQNVISHQICVTSTLEYASAKDYLSIFTSLSKLFSPSSALPATAGQVTTVQAIVIRSAGDKEKEITAKIGQANFAFVRPITVQSLVIGICSWRGHAH